MELAERMRQQNQEQFETLVRMHLSFELDLNTDDNGVALSEKGKFRLRFNFNKKHKTSQSSKSGSPVLSKECVGQLRHLMEFLMMEQNVIQEGIFRRTGSVARQTELKNRVNDGTGAPITLDNGTYTVHDCASVLKGVLADLPEPLLTDTYGPAHLQMAELYNSLGSPGQTKATRLLHSLQLLILLLPVANRLLLKEIIEMLNETIKYESSNKMSADSLATLFTPHLICPKKLTPEALHATAQNLSGIISFMITKGSEIFDIPPKLATDIRAYFVEQKRKQTLSPEQILDESVTSDSTANTVYTFIDRERTAQAHVQNPTDTCLAQLYAYIQSLPESSKKRKLIKQFNKENGQGTPLQVQKLHRLKNGNSASKSNSKSLGDSIKRHIFQKNLMSKTPKPAVPSFHTTPSNVFTPRTATSAAASSAAANTFDTPNRTASYPAHQMALKSRVLFQSPAAPSLDSTASLSVNLGTPTQQTPKNISPSTSLEDVDTDDDPIESNEFERLSETITKLQNASSYANNVGFPIAKKSVAFEQDDYSEEGDDIENQNADCKSRHKSESDLSNILSLSTNNRVSPITNQSNVLKRGNGTGGRYIANKLLKGVSMVNLLSPDSNPLLHKTFKSNEQIATPLGHSANIRLGDPVNENIRTPFNRSQPQSKSQPTFDEDIDDPDFVATPNSQRTSSRRNSDIDDFSDGLHTPLGEQRHRQFVVGRRSMSPITKSTQRMSKAMQESIMTPRSRKPVMLNGALFGGLTDQQNNQTSFSSLREENEEELKAEFDYDCIVTDRLPGSPSPMYKSKSEGDFGDLVLHDESISRKLTVKHPSEGSGLSMIGVASDGQLMTMDTLSSTFRNYLLSRSVISTSPVDSSFSSHPDDFGSTSDLNNLVESSELSESLLYCLDGNQPADVSGNNVDTFSSGNELISATGSRVSYVPQVSRKRVANCGEEGLDVDGTYFEKLHPKKIVVAIAVPGETSL